MFKFLLRFILLVIVLGVLSFGGLILYGTITDYQPEPETSMDVEIKAGGIVSTEIDTILNFFNWNVGYGGLGAEMDFFYDGGKTVRAPRENWDAYFDGIKKTILTNDSIDFYLIQEIDQLSKRSYQVNQYDSIYRILQKYSASFGLNYNVKYVPLPFTNGLGKVYSGVATYSKYIPASAQRFQYPGKFPWPTRIFFLDRCFLSQRYKLSNGKELVVINTHNSAYDETGEIKKSEMDFLKKHMMKEHAAGNYVIIGGDFNQCPPGFDTKKFMVGSYTEFIPPALEEGWTPAGWKFCYDDSTPSNRHLDGPLDDKTFKTIIDYYLISPNVELLSVKTIDLGFANSDHQPVIMKIKLQN
ncbi:MAG: endonuclease/exonuclease/phosphatase family protein [Fimbriimonadaceae bacterium]|nr:endonuclease/exonuclease/phosphatase family protein [Chitinophagales bacterium]